MDKIHTKHIINLGLKYYFQIIFILRNKYN
jgi:hypothetical protein